MDHSGRLFNCARCRSQAVICSDCDRNNIYCSKQCAEAARQKSLRAAGQRYQDSRRGQLKHADRQRRYRARQKEKVTHHSSSAPAANDLLFYEQNKQVACSIQLSIQGIYCHFCGRSCTEFLRIGFLRHSQRTSSWPLAP
jgi:hypothetical protein